MMDLNRATILGNLTRDPEMRQTPTNRSVAVFTIATNRRWTNSSGEQQESTEYHDVVAWGKLAEICNQILYKGRKAYVEGRLQTHSWEGQDGAKRQKTEIIAENVIAVGSPKAGAEMKAAPATNYDTEKSTPKSKNVASAGSKSNDKDIKKPAEDDEKIDLDDIPF